MLATSPKCPPKAPMPPKAFAAAQRAPARSLIYKCLGGLGTLGALSAEVGRICQRPAQAAHKTSRRREVVL